MITIIHEVHFSKPRTIIDLTAVRGGVHISNNELGHPHKKTNQESWQGAGRSQTPPQDTQSKHHGYGWGQVRLDGLDVYKQLRAGRALDDWQPTQADTNKDSDNYTTNNDLLSLPSLKCVKQQFHFKNQSRAQSFSGSLSAVGRRDKLWDNGFQFPIWLALRITIHEQWEWERKSKFSEILPNFWVMYVSNGKVTARQHSIANCFRSANFFRPLHTVPARFLDDFER